MATSGRAAYEDGGRFNCVAWASTSGALWWPVYLCNPMTMADDLHVLGHSHKDYRTERYPGIPVVYYLGTYEFEHGKAEVKEWFCPEFEHLAQEPSVPDDVLVDWCRALAEAQAIRSTGVVPYMLPSDLDNRLPPVPRLCNASEGSVVWLFTHGHPWRPCFILNPFSLVAKQGNSSHLVRLVNNAQKDPSRYYLVYTFGVHAIQLFNRSKSKAGIKLWNCPEHQGFLRGIPRPSAQGQVILHRGVDHATAFLKSGSNLDGLVLPGFNVDKNPRTHRPLIIYQPPKPKHPEPTTHSYPLRSKQSQEPTAGVTVVAPPTPQPTPAKWATRERYPFGMAWARITNMMWSPIHLCQKTDWTTHKAGHQKLAEYKIRVHIYCFATHTFRTWSGQFHPWLGATDHIKQLRAVGMGQVFNEARDFIAKYDKLERVLILQNAIESLGPN